MQVPPSVRLEELRPDQVAERWAVAPIAFVPIGCIEYHGPHLPMGVDGFTAHEVCRQAAERAGGVVHPVSYLANGCLNLPYTITYPAEIVEAWARQIISEFHHRGARLVVLLTGHGPLDLNHLLKRVANEYQSPEAMAYGLCYLELNAARLTEPQLGEPTVIDHASTIETSWMLATHPQLVDLAQLPDDPEATTVGVYGKNPRFTAASETGLLQQQMCAELLAKRCQALLAGNPIDVFADLRAFVDYVWPEPLVVQRSDASDGVHFWIANPGRASRYISAIREIQFDETAVNLEDASIVNRSVGEVGTPFLIRDLTPENGIYVRRGQQLAVVLPSAPRNPPDRITVTVELAGVREQVLHDAPDHETVSNLDELATGA